MARVYLIQPPLSHDELFVRGAKTSASIIPPLGLAYIASYLRKVGHECQILDGIAECLPMAQICRKAREFDVIGITVVSLYMLRVVELIRNLKQSGVKAPIVVGGPHVTVMPESLLSQGADYAVIGEGEITFAELVDCLTEKKDSVYDVKGLKFHNGKEYIYTGRRALIDSLDEIPLPARDLLPMHRYSTSIARARRQPSHSLITSRGCTGVCTFCSKRTFGYRVRYFSIPRIVEEFFLLRDKYGARDVAVWDDNFVVNHAVVNEVCDQLLQKGFDLTWSINSRIDVVNRDILTVLKRAGCTYIAYGIESGSRRLLNRINKRINKEQIRETIRLTKEVGIPIRGFFMVGLPTETREEILETVRFAIELDVELASFAMFIPFPGTVEYNRAQHEGEFDPQYFSKRVWPEINFPDKPVYVPRGMTAKELMAIHRNAYNRYYFRPKILWRKLLACFKNPGEFVPALKGGTTLIKNLLNI